MIESYTSCRGRPWPPSCPSSGWRSGCTPRYPTTASATSMESYANPAASLTRQGQINVRTLNGAAHTSPGGHPINATFDLPQCGPLEVSVCCSGLRCMTRRSTEGNCDIRISSREFCRNDCARSRYIEPFLARRVGMRLPCRYRSGRAGKPLGDLHHKTDWTAWDAPFRRAQTNHSRDFKEGTQRTAPRSRAGRNPPTRTQTIGPPGNTLLLYEAR